MSDTRTEDLAAICRLKYAYFRFLDTKCFDELGELLSVDATSAYQSGQMSQEGRDQIVAFLKQSLAGSGIITMHTGHHPEIDFSSDTEATGTWYLEDRVILPAADLEIHGTALYSDKYRKIDGEWKIAHTGYERIFERHTKPSTGETTHFESRFDD